MPAPTGVGMGTAVGEAPGLATSSSGTPVWHRAGQGVLEISQIIDRNQRFSGISEPQHILRGLVNKRRVRKEKETAEYHPNNKRDETDSDEGCIVLIHNGRF